LTVLERRLLEAERRGVRRAILACDGALPDRPLRIAIERVASGTPPPPGAEVVRADEIAGIPLRDASAIRRAEWALLRGLPKSFQGPVDALINCHVSLRLTRLLARTPVSPNQISVLALTIGLGAAILIALGGRTAQAVGGFLIALQSILDSCDGELARLRFQFSRFGQWLDNIADDITDSTLTLALGAATQDPIWIAAGVSAACARAVSQMFLYAWVRRLGGDFWDFRWWFERDVPDLDQVYDLRSPLTWLRSLGRRDVYIFLWAVLLIAGQPMAAVIYAVIIAAGYTVLTFLHLALAPSTRR
jgi:phosphatidylglycerophosphate synthase